MDTNVYQYFATAYGNLSSAFLSYNQNDNPENTSKALSATVLSIFAIMIALGLNPAEEMEKYDTMMNK